MNKLEFLEQLSSNLAGLSEGEKKSAIEYYAEIIDDKIEAGISESEAVESLGSPKTIMAQIMSDAVFKRMEGGSKKVLSSTSLLITSLCLSPILFPLGIALIAVVFSLFITLGALIISFGASSVAICIIIVPTIIEMLANGYAFFQITLITGAYVMLTGIFGLITTIFIKLFLIALHGITFSFSKLANKRLQKSDKFA